MRLGIAQFILVLSSASLLASCSSSSGGGGGGTTVTPATAYCPYLPSKTFGDPVTISGRAVYQWRKDGNGDVVSSTNHVLAFTAPSPIAATTYTVTINGTAYPYTCSGACLAVDTAIAIKNGIDMDSTRTVDVARSGSQLTLTPKSPNTYVSVAVSPTKYLRDYSARPIRHAEVRVTDATGVLVQCAETDANGDFSFQLAKNTGNATVAVTARSNNSSNTAYVMTDPTSNAHYSLSATFPTTASSSGTLMVAAGDGEALGGAFNILDQIHFAQDYLRTETANCSTGAAPNYFPDCTPVSTIPLVNVYWKAGKSPGDYIGVDGGISYYLNGKRELYILGGINGNMDKSDTDHFDNSIIVHEYGHFVEDQFAKPDSPGGSHDGKSIIDPRLSWGEGWADFFQAAVTGIAIYRDTYGHTGCTGTDYRGQACTGTNFTELIDPTGGDSYNDAPDTTNGGSGIEGNFREFSVARLLYDVAKVGGTSKFAEIWAALTGPTAGMKVVADPFKNIARLHRIQQASSGAVDWSALRGTSGENQTKVTGTSTTSYFATPIGTCATAVTMNVRKVASDDGSFERSDLLRNNDFFYYSHPGGTLNWNVAWTGAGTVDLDLYVYNTTYMYGRESSVLAFKRTVASGTSGSENITASLPAGTYMLNVQADTSIYGTTASAATAYTMTLNGSNICPNP